ncbi:MAG: hypothetical protein ACI35P_09300 [Bacillus sp. (in: firmicutes)]
MKDRSAIIIGVSIIIGFTILGACLLAVFEKGSDVVTENSEYRYELVPANDNNLIIFDKQSGAYWNKYIPSEEGPTNWEKGVSPIAGSE